jgi:signal peptidase I
VIDSYQQVSVDLIRAQARPGQTFKLRVISDSMLPLLHVGDVVVAETIEAAAALCGDVLVCQRGVEMITHRLINRQADRFYLKGDNRRVADEPLDDQSIVGRVIAIEQTGRSTHAVKRAVRTVDLQQPRWARLNRSVGRLSGWQARLSATSRLSGRLSVIPVWLLIRFLLLVIR